MTEYKVNVDVYGAWQDHPPVYRIFIDNEMICERSFLAMDYEFLREHIIVNLPSGEHTFRFEELKSKGPNRLSYKNLLVNDNPVTPTFTVSN